MAKTTWTDADPADFVGAVASAPRPDEPSRHRSYGTVNGVIIIAGSLYCNTEDRDAYLTAVADVARAARAAPGCLDFVQAADTIDGGRINVYERWESDADVEAFRVSGGDEDGPEPPELTGADVRKYRISAVESP